jgi:hypothetical protein
LRDLLRISKIGTKRATKINSSGRSTRDITRETKESILELFIQSANLWFVA